MQKKSKSLLTRLKRLKEKGFRDAYVQANIEHGVAHQIRLMREARGWSQTELADKASLGPQSGVARLEDPSYGRFTIATLLKLASTFDVALLVKFVPFGKLLQETEDLSASTLAPERFAVELPKLHAQILSWRVSKSVKFVPNVSAPRFSKTTEFSLPSGAFIKSVPIGGGIGQWRIQ